MGKKNIAKLQFSDCRRRVTVALFSPSPNANSKLPSIIFTAMPPRTKPTSNPASDRPSTRSKNANTHPGTAAQDALRVNAPRRDHAVIQKEKDAVKERKALKVQEKEANQARNEATKHIADEFRAQQVSKQASEEAEMPRKTTKGKVHCRCWTFLSLTYMLVTKKTPPNVSQAVSGNEKTSSSQPRAVGLTNTGTTGKKRKSEPQVGVSTPTQDAEQAPPPPKKKKKASVVEQIEPSQPTAMTTAMDRNNHDAPLNKKRMNNGGKKCPTGDESDDASESVNANPAHPAKKTKVTGNNLKAPIRRTGKIILMLKAAR
jgi:hypothetical protein